MFFEAVQGNGGARAALATLALVVAAVAAPGCKQAPEATSCETGIYCPAGTRCAARQAVCILDDCGDGRVQADEACDDGNLLDGDGCSKDCGSTEVCGNTITDRAVGEICDDGNTVSGDKCSADCKSTEGCGNGSKDTGEECDDRVETLTCNANCTVARRGDGIVNVTAGEACDGDGAGTGNGRDCAWQGCNLDCTLSKHGDGIVNPLDGEQCDGDGLGTGNGLNCESFICNANCTFSRAGDGQTNPSAGEQCDGGLPDGASTDCESAACNANCTVSRHGDGVVNPSAGEECDGGVKGGASTNCESATCNADCTTSRCGDTIVNLKAGEQCDDGNLGEEDDCLACRFAVCGDERVNTQGPTRLEVCDLGDFNGETSCPYGLMSCEGCDDTCTAPLTTVARYCGDGIKETFEACDDARSVACGTCGTTSCATVSLKKATGKITVSTPIVDGTSITLDDGTRAVVLELDPKNDECVAGVSFCVKPAATASAAEIADKIHDAITSLRGDGLIDINVNSSDGAVVALVHDSQGIIGNVPIAAAPASGGGIAVQGLSGGVGCAEGAACARGQDCVSGNCHSSRGTCN